MKTVKKILNLIPLLASWLVIMVIFWSWVFTFLTDAPRENKIVLFIDANVPGEKAISLMMEDESDDVIRLVKVKPFTYSMMDSSEIRTSDLYIVKESNIPEYLQWFAPLPESMSLLTPPYIIDGTPFGICVYDAESQSGICANEIEYENENYYLFFGNSSCHTSSSEGEARALIYARRLLGWD